MAAKKTEPKATPKSKVSAAKAAVKQTASKTIAAVKAEAQVVKNALQTEAKVVAKAIKPAAAKVGAGIAEGDKAPAFSLPDETGTTVTSASLAGKPYVVYFYPKDDTPGCTKEACDFRDNLRAFNAAKVRVLGVSPDSTARHAKFGNGVRVPGHVEAVLATLG